MSHSSQLEMEKQVRNMNVSKTNLSYLSHGRFRSKASHYIYIYICRRENENNFAQLFGICCNLLHVYKGFKKRSLQEGDFSLLSFNETRPNCHSDKIVCKLLRFAFTFFFVFLYKIQLVSNLI